MRMLRMENTSSRTGAGNAYRYAEPLASDVLQEWHRATYELSLMRSATVSMAHRQLNHPLTGKLLASLDGT